MGDTIAAKFRIAALAIALAGCSHAPKPVMQSTPQLSGKDLALQAEARGDWGAAARAWQSVVGAKPADRDATLALVRDLRRANACARALPYLETLRAANPSDVAVLLEAGKCEIVASHFETAQTILEAAVKADPKSWEAESVLATALDYRERSEDALLHHDRAVALAPHNAVALSNRAMSQALAGHLDEALAGMRRAAALPDAPARVRGNLAMLEAIAGHGDVAAALARTSNDDPERAALLERIAAAAKK